MKKTIVLLAVISSLCLISKISFAQASKQAPKWSWAIIPEGKSMAVDASGNIYIADYSLTKYNTNGIVVWKNVLFSSQSSIISSSVTVDNSGYIYVIGNFINNISLGDILYYLNNSDNTDNTSDSFLAKFDANGNFIWAKKWGGINDDYASSIAVDTSGNSYVTGSFNSHTLVFGHFTLTNIDDSGNTSDLFLTKFDANGNVIWAKCSGGTKDDYASSIAVDASGNSYVAGSFNSHNLVFGYFTLTNIDDSGNTSDLFLTKFDTNGNVIWAKCSGGTKDDYASSIAVDASGNSCVAGFFNSHNLVFGSDTLKNASKEDYIFDELLLKYDAKGKALWAKSIGSETNNSNRSYIAVDASGNSYVAGSFNSYNLVFGSVTLKNVDKTGHTSALFLAKYDYCGKELWAKSLGGMNIYHFLNYDVNPSSVAIDASGNAYVTGNFSCWNLIFDSATTLYNMYPQNPKDGSTTPTSFLAKLPAK